MARSGSCAAPSQSTSSSGGDGGRQYQGGLQSLLLTEVCTPPARERASASTHLFSNAVPAIHTSSSHPHPLHLPLLLLPSHQIAPVLLVACSLLAACHLYSRIEKSRTRVPNPAQPATSVAGPSFAGRSGHDGGTLAATPRGSRAALRPPPMALPPTEPPPTEPRTPSPPPPPLSPSTPSGW